MATATDLTTLRRMLGGRGTTGVGGLDIMTLIPTAFVGAFAAGSMTSVQYLQNTEWGSKHFSGMGYGIFRPGAASSADYYRPAGDLTNTTGVLAHTGSNYADTTVGTEDVELWKGRIRPNEEVHDAINRALDNVYTSIYVPLSELSNLDGDMVATTDTNWTDVGTPTTSAKATTAEYTPYLTRSYHLVGDAVDEGTRSAALRIRNSKSVKAFTISTVVSGTAGFQYYDVTNSATAGTQITTDYREPQLMCLPWTAVPDTCHSIALRMTGTTNPSDIYWSGAWLYRMGNRTLQLPSYIEENFQSPSIFQAVPTYGSGTNTYDALSLELTELQEGRDYNLVGHPAEANPNSVQFLRDDCFDWPLFVEARVPWSYFGALTAETDTTKCPVTQLVPAAKMELITSVLSKRPGFDAKALAVDFAKAKQEYDKANKSRVVVPVAKTKAYYRGPITVGL